MSYTILYKRLFIRLSDGSFVAMAQCGDNNVYETINPRRRSRSWEGWHCVSGTAGVKVSYTRAEIESYLAVQKRRVQDRAIRDLQEQGLITQNCQNPAVTDWRRHFGWYSGIAVGSRAPRSTAWPSYSNFFLQGMDRAIDLGTFVKLAGALKVSWWEDHANRCITGIRDEETLRRTFDEAMAKSEDGVAWVSPARDWYLESAADARFASATKGYVIQATGSYRGWVSSLFPLSFSEDKGDAEIFPKSAVEGPEGHLDNILRAFCPEVKDICFYPV